MGILRGKVKMNLGHSSFIFTPTGFFPEMDNISIFLLARSGV